MTSEEITFSSTELEQLRQQVIGDVMRYGDKVLWKKAFDYYNSKHPDRRPFDLGCKTCYGKVVQYIFANYLMRKC